MTDDSTYSCRWPFRVKFLVPSQRETSSFSKIKRTQVFPDIINRCLSIWWKDGQQMADSRSKCDCPPSMTTLIPWTRPWMTLRISGAVMRASSCVSRTILRRTVQRPSLRKPSLQISLRCAEQGDTSTKTGLTRSCLVELSGRQSERGE